MKANLYQVKVRRDAHTITPTIVTEHEIPILQTIFGQENIQTAEGGLLDMKKIKSIEPAGQINLSDSEFDRLVSKYGANEKGVVVEQVYGTRAAGGLDKAIEANAAAIAAAEKKSAGSSKPGAGGPQE